MLTNGRFIAPTLLFVGAALACGRSNLKALGTGGAGGDGAGGEGLAGGGGTGPRCGDGITEAGEACDDGNTIDSDDCLASCVAASCGDGFVWQGVEPCDDGNQSDDDGCRGDCTLPTCGDGDLDPGEECDDGNRDDFDACRNDCLVPACGDAVVDPGEACDDGNQNHFDGCRNDCSLPFCGDGILDAAEACDDGNQNPFDGCRNDCSLPSCGDGVLDPGEQCDDGNQVSGDGCQASCLFPFCGDGVLDPGEQCDDGNASSQDACVVGCSLATCGDGFLFVGVEECDDGNQIGGDGCSITCTLPVCGDGLVEAGEACDLGSLNADRPALEIEQLGTKTGVEPLDQPQGVFTFYDYFSASSHTGLEQVQTSRIYFYRHIQSEVLALVMHHGIDAFPSQPLASVDFTLTGVPPAVSIAMSDDVGELFVASPGTIVGDWLFQNNSDGGALTNLPFPGSWQITLQSSFGGGISSWQFVDEGTTMLPLQQNQTLVLRAFATPSPCRLDCTVPACGDGALDGGEICDDANTTGGDGCSSTCDALD